jgi:hypothetical protein
MWDFVMDKSGAGAGFLRKLRFPLPIYIPPISPQSPSPIIRVWYNSPVVAAVPKVPPNKLKKKNSPPPQNTPLFSTRPSHVHRSYSSQFEAICWTEVIQKAPLHKLCIKQTNSSQVRRITRRRAATVFSWYCRRKENTRWKEMRKRGVNDILRER